MRKNFYWKKPIGGAWSQERKSQERNDRKSFTSMKPKAKTSFAIVTKSLDPESVDISNLGN